MSLSNFNVADDPWIPVIGADGQAREVGLRAALLQAHEFVVIRDPIPLVEFGLHRLLTAFVLDIFQPNGLTGLRKLLLAGQFDPGKLEAYFQEHAARFRLFDERRPFLQTPGMDTDTAKALAGIAPLTPSGSNAGHFDHAHESEFGVSPAAAARLLTTLAPFMTAGGAGLSPSINGAPPWYVLIRGDNLFQTLCLNTYALHVDAPGNAGPAWRMDGPPGGERRKDWSLLEALTWRPRRVQLIPGAPGRCSISGVESSNLVRTMKFKPGDSCDFAWRDPSVPYRLDAAKKTATALRPQEGRAVWRDTGPLALLTEKEAKPDAKVAFERPARVSQYAFLDRQGALPEDHELRLTAYGMRTDMKMKVFEWQREDLAIPVPLIINTRFAREAQTAMDQAAEAAGLLRQAIVRCYPREGAGAKNPFGSLAGAAQRRFWNLLRPHYDILLRKMADLPGDDVPVALRDDWAKTNRHTTRFAFEEAAGDLVTDGDLLRRQVNARAWLAGKLRAIFASQEEKTARKKRRDSKAAPVPIQGDLYDG